MVPLTLNPKPLNRLGLPTGLSLQVPQARSDARARRAPCAWALGLGIQGLAVKGSGVWEFFEVRTSINPQPLQIPIEGNLVLWQLKLNFQN